MKLDRDVALWIFAVGATAFAVWQTRRRPLAPPDLEPPPAFVGAMSAVPPESLASAAEMVESRNPFRPDRRPAALAFGAEAVAAASAPRRQLPSLSLQGIVGGPPWSAVVRGIPGLDGPVLLQPGDTVAGLRVVAVMSRSLIIATSDTSWTIHMEEVRP